MLISALSSSFANGVAGQSGAASLSIKLLRIIRAELVVSTFMSQLFLFIELSACICGQGASRLRANDTAQTRLRLSKRVSVDA